MEGHSALRSGRQRVGRGNTDSAGVAATHSRPLSLACPPPPFIKKKRDWTKADGIFTFMSFKKS